MRGEVHTNNIESFWSLLKRGVIGTYHNVSKKYLPLYLNEFSWRFNNRKNPNIFFYHQITLKTHGVRRAGSAALDLCNVACGRFEAFWEFKLNPWDTAAGVLIVEEAGGRVTDFAGRPFPVDSRETLASNGLVHDALMHEFAEIFAGRGLEPLPDPREFARK